MSKNFIKAYNKTVFAQISVNTDKNPTSPSSIQTPKTPNVLSPITPNVTKPNLMLLEIAKQKQEQIILTHQKEEVEKRKQEKLLQEQELLQKEQELAALKAKMDLEKAILLKEQQLKQQQQMVYEEQLKKEKEKVLQGETNFKLEQEKFEKEKEEMVLQSQNLQNQITLLSEVRSPIQIQSPPAYLFLTDDTPENEYNIAHPKPPTPPPLPTGIDPEYVEIQQESEEHTLEPDLNLGIEEEVTLEGDTGNNTENEYEIL